MNERPLVSTILKDSEYKEKYHIYLNEIVTKYLDSDYLENMTTKVADLIDPYVKDDPTRFYSYEDFKTNMTSKVEGSSDNKGQKSTPGILEVAQKMSNTINSQLSGETSSVKDKNTEETSEASTVSPEDIGNAKDFDNKRENSPQNGDQPPGNGNMNGDIPQNRDLPADAGVKSNTKNNDPNGANREAPTNKGNSKMGENPNGRGNSKQNLIIVGISILIMIIALIFTKLFRKRRMFR